MGRKKVKSKRKALAKRKAPAKRKRKAAKKKTTPTSTASVTSDPEFTQEELVIRRHALDAAAKDRDDWSTSDARSVRQWEEIREEKDRWAFYATIPQKHMIALADVSNARVLIDAAEHHGMPRQRASKNRVLYNLAEFLPWLWTKAFDRSKKPAGDDDPDTVKKWLDVEERMLKLSAAARELVNREYIRSQLMRASEPFRNALDSLQRKDPEAYGPVAKAAELFFADIEEATRDAEAAD